MSKKKTDLTTQKINLLPMQIFFLISPFFFGGFHVFVSCIFSVILFGFLFYLSSKKPGITVRINDALLVVVVFLFFYLLSSIWAVDSGMAVMGFWKFLPIFPLLLIIMQLDEEQKRELFKTVPLSGCIMVAFSFPLHLIPQLKEYFTVAGRLSGFFQYPNSFAIFLLAGLIIVTQYYNSKKIIAVLSALLVFGIFESGSRIVFVFLILTVVLLCLLAKNKFIKYSLLLILVLGVISAIIYAHFADNYDTVGRFLTSSLKSSTILGRLLYYKDVLPVIFKHPFGLGYMGYYFSQQEFQTGVYSVLYVHNELLQFLLDIGWIPTVLFVVVILESLFSKKTDICSKLLIIIICGHSLFDFDLQFISVFFVLIAALETNKGKTKNIFLNFKKVVVAGTMVILLTVYFGIANFTQYIGKNELAFKIYPLNTTAEIQMLVECNDVAKQRAIAENILHRNTKLPIVYSALANYEFSQGDIEKFIEYKNQAIALAPYSYEEYEDFAIKLIEAMDKYNSIGDLQSADYCYTVLINLRDNLENLKNKASSFALKIDDKPVFEFSNEINDYINQIEEVKQ